MSDVVVLVPTQWAREEACRRSEAARDFGRFMDRFTRWHDKGFDHWLKQVGQNCPADLRREAAEQARWMADAWRHYEQWLSTSRPQMEAT